jgi:cytochrome b561
MRKKVAYYSKGSKFFHWLIAIIVIAMLSGSFFLGSLPDQYQPSAYMIHKSFGLTVLFLVIARLFWIHHTGKPALPNTVPMWQRILSRTVQYSLYVLLICMPVCGWVMSVAGGRVPSYFGLFAMPLPIKANEALSEFMEESHKIIAWILIALIVLHIAGAIKHHFIDKDNVLKRMLPGGR